MKKLAILGTVGVPAAYGGFETLADNLVQYAQTQGLAVKLAVYCSGEPRAERTYCGAELRFVRFDANGVSSIVYDVVSMFSAARRGDQVLLLLGVSGAIAIPLVRLLFKCKIVTNIDGIEWKRDKWHALAKSYLKFSEWLAVKCSHEVICDNQEIAHHVSRSYHKPSAVIAYGGDHAIAIDRKPADLDLPAAYALALCRIEPENNVEMILQAFSQTTDRHLVFIGNWQGSEFGQQMRVRYRDCKHLHLHDPIYDSGRLKTIRAGASLYVHGHSAGGTNPSLVEMMHFGLPIAAYDCRFNRYSTDDQAMFFADGTQLHEIINASDYSALAEVGKNMQRIATQRYTWAAVGERYFKLLLNC